MMIDGLPAELLEAPVGITGIYPGFVATDMIAGNAFDSSVAISAEEAGRLIVEGLLRGDDETIFPAEMGQFAAQIGTLSPRQCANAVRQLMNNDFSSS